MIDRFLYNFFSWIDRQFEKVDEVLTFNFPKKKYKKNDKSKN